jgi:proteasome lid subunit RPN8/RPN11
MEYLRLTHEHAHALIRHAQASYPAEACGLIGGQANTACMVIPVANVAANPQTQYQMTPNELLQGLKTLEAAGLDLIGIYHSHPKSDPIPSQIDIQMAEIHYPQAAQVIISLKHQHPRLKAWQIQPGQIAALDIIIGKAAVAIPDNHLSRAQQIAILLAASVSLLLMLSISLALLPPAPILTPAPR